jgi:hypothetical protein
MSAVSASVSIQPLMYASSSMPARLRAWTPKRAQTITNSPMNVSQPTPSTVSVIMTQLIAGWVPVRWIERDVDVGKLLAGPPMPGEG